MIYSVCCLQNSSGLSLNGVSLLITLVGAMRSGFHVEEAGNRRGEWWNADDLSGGGNRHAKVPCILIGEVVL